MMSSPFDSYPPILSADQLAEMLGISRAGAYQLLHQETFPTLRIGKRMLVPKDKLLIWIDQHTGGTEISV
jgi:excisionase family DNA binding protein